MQQNSKTQYVKDIKREKYELLYKKNPTQFSWREKEKLIKNPTKRKKLEKKAQIQGFLFCGKTVEYPRFGAQIEWNAQKNRNVKIMWKEFERIFYMG